MGRPRSSCNGSRLANGGPEQDHARIFSTTADWKDLWTYHAVAAIIRSNSILRGLSGVDPARVGITGISWGGYLTCIAAGVDPRFACAIPVYGCEFLQHNSADDWMKLFADMAPAQRQAWQDRKWSSTSARRTDGYVRAELVEDVSACYLAIEDDRGAYVSSPHVEVEADHA